MINFVKNLGFIAVIGIVQSVYADIEWTTGVSLGHSAHVSSFWGGNSSGGGAGILCPESVRDQPRVQTLDTYEGKIIHELSYKDDPSPYWMQIEFLAEKLNFDFSLKSEFKEAYQDIVGRIKFLPKGVSIHVPPDLGDGPVPYPTGCQIIAIGYHESDGVLYTSKDAWDLMSESEKATFLVHEMVYKTARYHDKAEDSKSSRKTVAFLTSDWMPDQDDNKYNIFKPIWWAYSPDCLFCGRADILPATGMESRIISNGFEKFNPILFTDNENEIEVIVPNPKNKILVIDAECFRYADFKGSDSIFQSAREQVAGQQDTVKLKMSIPKDNPDCQVVKINVSAPYSYLEPGKSYSINLNGKHFFDIEDLKNPFDNSSSLFLPVFYE